MDRFLETIVKRRKARVAEARANAVSEVRVKQVRDGGGAPPSPVAEIRQCSNLLIAEIKRASPSKGVFAPKIDVTGQALRYEKGNAGMISVLCEPDYFGGSRGDVSAVARAVRVPVLCKDFVVDPCQLGWAREDGARWVLLIARVLGAALPGFVSDALDLGLEPLVEVHNEDEMALAVSAGSRVIGFNARDLDTFQVDLGVVERLAPLCPSACACIAESGIRGADDLLRLRGSGVHGFLIGEALMKAPNPEEMLVEYGRVLERGMRMKTS